MNGFLAPWHAMGMRAFVWIFPLVLACTVVPLFSSRKGPTAVTLRSILYRLVLAFLLVCIGVQLDLFTRQYL